MLGKMTYPSRDLNPRSSCHGANPFLKFLSSDSISLSFMEDSNVDY